MYCPHCGAANPDGPDVKFCRSCGAEFAAQSAIAAGPAPGQPPIMETEAGFAPGAPYAIPPQPAYTAGTPYGSPTMAAPLQAAVFPYGGFWIRLVAYILDGLILGAAQLAVAIAVGAASAAGGMRGESAFEAAFGTAYVAGFLISLVYYVALPPTAGATLGKLVLGYHIVAADGRHIGFGRALGRYLGYIVSGLVLCLGFIWIGIDSYKQGWHDKIAGTYVVRKEFVRP